MVWGMIHPPGSNGFDLPGEFEGPAGVASNGWLERLTRHYLEQMSAEEQAIFQVEYGAGAHSYACHAINKFSIRRERGEHFPGAATAIRDHEKPIFYRSTGNFGKLASLATFHGPVLTVDEALKSFIEWLEPGVHTFVPIEVRRGRDKPVIGTRHILVVEQRIDSFSEALSPAGSFKVCDYRSEILHDDAAASIRRLAFRRERIGNAHLWLEARFRTYLLCISDRLRAEIVDAGLRIPRHMPMKEV